MLVRYIVGVYVVVGLLLEVLMFDIADMKRLVEQIAKMQFDAQIRADGFENSQNILAKMLSKKKNRNYVNYESNDDEEIVKPTYDNDMVLN